MCTAVMLSVVANTTGQNSVLRHIHATLALLCWRLPGHFSGVDLKLLVLEHPRQQCEPCWFQAPPCMFSKPVYSLPQVDNFMEQHRVRDLL